jgi:hypothetical protein
MGQIFNACIYDTDDMTCCVIDADKFHANCYSFSGTVVSTHYLLRQKPYRVMWGGGYVLMDDYIETVSRTEDLLGLSTYISYEDIQFKNEDLEEKNWLYNEKFICDNHNRWKRINVWDEARKYFDWDRTHSVKYNGYLLNHTQKLAVNISDYAAQSLVIMSDPSVRKFDEMIDLVPVLTETGGGVSMALFEGLAADSTEELAETWCGDLLQIVDQLPDDYECINCCFAECWDRAYFCYRVFGADASNYVLGDRHGKRYECAKIGIFGSSRGPAHYIRIELTEDKIRYIPELASKATNVPTTENGKIS